MGRRISKTVQGGTPTQYLYDGANAVQETVGSTINPILVGRGIDERFARNDTTGRTYFLSDAINSTIALTNSSGAIQNQYSYDPYGNTSQSGTGFTNPYQYTGREADTAGLYYYRARYYSPMMGGFISEDPAGFGGGQLSFYAYVGGNPLSNTDPMGLACNGAYLDRGDYMGYYQAACSDGDADACFDQNVAGNTGWAGQMANNRLRNAIKKYDPCGDVDSIMEQIRQDLANDYANYLPQSESDASWPDASDIAAYHWSEFAQFNLPASTFGGTPFGESFIIGQQFWCPECQLPPAAPAPILP
jgi:RHS repeat-associated protein